MPTKTIITIGLLILPILLIQVGVVLYALIDLSRRKAVRGPRWAWVVALILCIFSIPAGILISGIYLTWGRQHGAETDDDTD